MAELKNPADAFLARLDAVEARLAAHAAAPTPGGLTEPDPPTGEQWDAGQVWSHLSEILGYWQREVDMLVARQSPDAVPFGRVKSDAGRIAAVDARRHEPAADNWERVTPAIAELRAFLEQSTPQTWALRGHHSARGEMSMERIVDEFMVGHLEEHAEQLDGLTERAHAQ